MKTFNFILFLCLVLANNLRAQISENVDLSITSQSMEKVYFCKNLPALSYTNLSIGANSFVNKDTEESSIYGGVPIKKIGERN